MGTDRRRNTAVLRRRTQARRRYARIVNAIIYVAKIGCQWLTFRRFSSVGNGSHVFSQVKETRLLDKINDKHCRKVRAAEGRVPEPNALIVDSQSVKTTKNAKERGFDAGKKVVEIKRHIAADVLGLIVYPVITTGSVQYRDGAKLLFAELAKTQPQRLQRKWADGGCQGQLFGYTKTTYGELEIVKRNADVKGFCV